VVNDSLEIGSMLPQIEWANENKLPVIVMNPNYNRDPKTSKSIPGSTSMRDHACFVWKNYVENSRFKKLFVIAHSAGGGCILSI
jgi:hypothetical protein